MPFNGAGQFVPVAAPQFPAVSGSLIKPGDYNAVINDLMNNGLSVCVTRNGQSPPTANLPMGGFKFTGLAAGASSGDSATYGQVQAVNTSLTNFENALAATTGATLVGTADGWANAAASLNARGVTVATKAAAQALTIAKASGAVIVMGQDGGVFRRNPANTASAEDGGTFCGTIIRPTDYATQGILQRVDGGPLNVWWFGAKGDNATDDTAAIVSTIAVALATARSVYFPAGLYVISSVITLSAQATPYLPSIKLLGDGVFESQIVCNGTGFVQSNQTQVNDNISIAQLGIKKGTTTALIGLDIGTVRNSTFDNVRVAGFQTGFSISVNQGVGNYWNRFIACEANCDGSAGSIGFALGNNGATSLHDLDYNTFIGCKSFSAHDGVYVYNAIGCEIIGHLSNSCTNALTILAGNNNRIQIDAEAVTNMGSAANITHANTLDLYNDGNLATAFVDNGQNYFVGQVVQQQVLPNSSRILDFGMQDRIGTAFTAASKNLFQLAPTSNEFAATVTVTSCGYIVGTAEFASVQVFDITRTGSGAITVTPVRTSGTAGVITATVGTNLVTFAMTGNAAAQAVGQVAVDIKGIGVPQAYPYMQPLEYSRL